MSAFQKGWYLIYTKPRHEKKVHKYLSEKGITSFLPMKKKVQVFNNRKRVIDFPLFPSYIFIYLNDIVEYYTGADMGGVLYYVKDGREVARVSETVIDNVKIVTEHADNIEVSDIGFQAGQRTVIREGALAGLSCEIIEVNCRQKLLVRIDLLKRNLLLTLSEKSLVPYAQLYAR
jgi:transcription antitermination factor NusG